MEEKKGGRKRERDVGKRKDGGDERGIHLCYLLLKPPITSHFSNIPLMKWLRFLSSASLSAGRCLPLTGASVSRS